MSSENSQPILILGMHRSGTSYLAQLMQALGVFIGDDLIGPEKGNPRGHFEARQVLEFHQELIARRERPVRRAFDNGMLVQERLDTAFDDAEQQQALDLIAALRRPGFWGWKEPRTCLFLESWQKLLPEARAVVVYRHPLEVHQSLLRREHWDLSLFPDQALRSYVVHNRILLEQAGDAFCINANTAFADVAGLADTLRTRFGFAGTGPLPEFHSAEFKTLRVSKALHVLFSRFFPEAAAVFDELQERADIPYAWETREDDPMLEQAAEHIAPLLQDMPPAARASFVPLLDWWAAGRDSSLFAHYEKLGREIGMHIRVVKKWNDKAAVIFEENKRLAAEYERMGKDYAKQQQFLAKQTETQAKIWAELQRTGDSWKEQKAFIEKMQQENRALRAEVERLQGLVAKGEAGG